MAPAISYWTIAALVLGFAVLLPFIMGFFGGNKFEVKGKTILLTGASEGMGKSVAIQLAQKGANLMIVSRSVEKLEAALLEIKAAASSPSQRFHYLSADVTLANESARILTETTTLLGSAPDIVWCIAGSSHPALFLDTPISTMRSQMDMNYWSCVDMAHAVLSRWLSPDATPADRHLIFTSSVLAFYSTTGYSPYSPAKAALKSLADTLDQELLLYPNPPKIHVVFPATITSPGLERENRTKPAVTLLLEEADPVQSPDQVAKAAIAGLERGEFLITTGILGSAMRACAWGGSRRNAGLKDWVVECGLAAVWGVVRWDLDGKVKKWGVEKGFMRGGTTSAK
ncbi:short-chain dehydrogenase protein [Rutstroemia sp. NJR-2017a BVV2]|nr:short-chain dehydrogenase protein [Rutstroemia sp. NJR-2017a BVV2]